jgi:hypothetical protein
VFAQKIKVPQVNRVYDIFLPLYRGSRQQNIFWTAPLLSVHPAYEHSIRSASRQQWPVIKRWSSLFCLQLLFCCQDIRVSTLVCSGSAWTDRTQHFMPSENFLFYFISRKFTIYSTNGAISKYVIRKHLCGAIIQWWFSYIYCAICCACVYSSSSLWSFKPEGHCRLSLRLTFNGLPNSVT